MSKSKKSKSNSVSQPNSIFYMSLWICVALATTVYISSLVTNTPFQLAKNNTNQQITKKHSQEKDLDKKLISLQQTVASSNKQLSQLNKRYNAIEYKMSTIHGSISQLAKENSKLKTQLKSLEDTVGPITGSLKSAKTPKQQVLKPREKTQPPVIQIPFKDLTQQREKTQTKALLSNKVQQQKDTRQQQLAANQIPIPVLRQIAKKQQDESKNPLTKPEITRTSFAIALGTYPDLKQLKKAWLVLAKKYNSALGALKPRFITIVVNNRPQYKLVSGPLTNALDAAKICFHLQQSKTFCQQTVYQGSDI